MSKQYDFSKDYERVITLGIVYYLYMKHQEELDNQKEKRKGRTQEGMGETLPSRELQV